MQLYCDACGEQANGPSGGERCLRDMTMELGEEAACNGTYQAESVEEKARELMAAADGLLGWEQALWMAGRELQ